jgi:hypothetical protein
MPDEDDQHSRSPFPAWLKDLAYVGGLIVALVIFGQSLKSDQRSTREQQARMAEDLKAMAADVQTIASKLPNPEVLDLRFKGLEGSLTQLRADFDLEVLKNQKYKEDLTRDLIKKGIVD